MIKSLGRRHRFEHFRSSDFGQAARLFAKVGFTSWPAIAKLDEETRKFLREDLRKAHKCSARELSLVNDIFTYYENEKPRRASPKEAGWRREPPYEELVIPQMVERWTVNLSTLGGYLIPDQEMTNMFSKEFYEASKKEPPYTPYVLPELHKKPWPVPLLSHERAAQF